MKNLLTIGKWAVISSLFLLISCQQESIDLSGNWNFQIDRQDVGQEQKWFSQILEGSIVLPGSMASNGLGDPITLETIWTGGMRDPNWFTDPNYAPYFHPEDVRMPYWLQPEKKYTGAAWYQKSFTIPEKWNHQAIKIFLERVHWESTIWIDNELIGSQNSLGTPHEYWINPGLKPGLHLLTIRVDNRMKAVDVGWDSHSVSDHTQSNWNGMVGELKIIPVPAIRIQDVRINSSIEDRTVKVSGNIFNSEKTTNQVKLIAKIKGTQVRGLTRSVSLDLLPGANSFNMELELGEKALLWDEFDPNLYTLDLTAKSGSKKDDFSERFGLRKIKATGDGIFVNNRPSFLRGTLECAIFPLTGYPSTHPEDWSRIMRVIKAHGLNHMRFHSWCPPEAAFIAADEAGVYLQVECSSWANSTSRIGDGLPIDQFIWEESKRIVANYGNHPSFVMMLYGNEPAGQNQNAFLTEFVNYWKENDPRRIYSSGAGWPQLPVNDYHNIPGPRIQGWGEQLNSIINAQPPSSNYDWSAKLQKTISRNPGTQSPGPENRIPVVSHEIGQWCVYPNLKETAKYTGVLKARNFEIFKESLEAHQMAELADSFLFASGRLQALCYKADIEAALRTPYFGGFQLLDLHDFPGQGTALVGVLDPFWEEKGYISPAEFSQFCNSTVPLARLEKHVFLEGETLNVPVQIAHYGKTELQNQNPAWKLFELKSKSEDTLVAARGDFGPQTIPLGNQHFLGSVSHTFKTTGIPRQLKLEVSGAGFVNTWDIWVYPKAIPNLEPSNTNELHPGSLCTELSTKTIEYLLNGGSIILSLGQGKVSQEFGGSVGVGFSSIFWNTAWTGGQKPHTLGILCNPDHPALKEFPTESHSNWQWWDAMSQADAIQLDRLSPQLQPIVRIIDDWVSNRPLALILEAKIGKGKILISGADLHTDLENRPAANQLRTSLEAYMLSGNFHPLVELSPEQLQAIIARNP